MQAAGPVHEGLLALDTTKTERLVEADGVDLAPERREVARVFLPQRIHTRAHDAAPDAAPEPAKEAAEAEEPQQVTPEETPAEAPAPAPAPREAPRRRPCQGRGSAGDERSRKSGDRRGDGREPRSGAALVGEEEEILKICGWLP